GGSSDSVGGESLLRLAVVFRWRFRLFDCGLFGGGRCFALLLLFGSLDGGLVVLVRRVRRRPAAERSSAGDPHGFGCSCRRSRPQLLWRACVGFRSVRRGSGVVRRLGIVVADHRRKAATAFRSGGSWG